MTALQMAGGPARQRTFGEAAYDGMVATLQKVLPAEHMPDPGALLEDLTLPAEVRSLIAEPLQRLGCRMDDQAERDLVGRTRRFTVISKDGVSRFLIHLPQQLLSDPAPANLEALNNLGIFFARRQTAALRLCSVGLPAPEAAYVALMRVGWKRLFRIDVEFVQWDLFEVLAQPGPQSPEELLCIAILDCEEFLAGAGAGSTSGPTVPAGRPPRLTVLTGPQYAAFKDALSAAFDEQGLRELVKFRLNEELATVAGGRNEDEIVYNLIGWSLRTGRVDDLLRAALAANPTSPDLQAFVRQLDG